MSTTEGKGTYTEAEIPSKLSEYGLDEWYYEDKWIRRKYNTDGWPSTLMGVNAVGYLCEAAGHHADLTVTWGKFWVKLANHSAGGITDKDFALARKIEDTILWRPEPDSPLDGPMGKFVFSKSPTRELNAPIRQIAYPSTGYNKVGRGVLLGAYLFEGANAYEFTAMPPAERVARAVEFGAAIHPQYQSEFENGIAVAWHRVPFTLGCSGGWSEEARRQHYRNLCQIDGRIVLAGEHASELSAWQEGAILSALDAISRLHERVMKT